MQKGFKRVEYSPDADALVITFSDDKPEYGEGVGKNIIIHFPKAEGPSRSRFWTPANW